MAVYEVTLKVYVRAETQDDAERIGHAIQFDLDNDEVKAQLGEDYESVLGAQSHGVLSDAPEDERDWPDES